MINKILGMDAGTRERFIASIITAVTDFLIYFNIIKFSDEQVNSIIKLVAAIVSIIVWWVGFYYNEQFTEIACEKTGEMRAKKREKDEDYVVTEEIGGDEE